MITLWKELMLNSTCKRHMWLPTLRSFILGNKVAEEIALPLLLMPDSVYPEILNTWGLSCKNVHKSDLAPGPLWLLLLTMQNSLLESLFDGINLYLKII